MKGNYSHPKNLKEISFYGDVIGKPVIPKGKVFYSIKDGDSTSPDVWEGTGLNRVPVDGDSLVIRHNVFIPIPPNKSLILYDFIIEENGYAQIKGGSTVTLKITNKVRLYGTLNTLGLGTRFIFDISTSDYILDGLLISYIPLSHWLKYSSPEPQFIKPGEYQNLLLYSTYMANLYGDYIIDTEMQTYYSVTITHSYIEVGISSGNLYVYSFTYIYASVLKIHRQLSNSGVLDFRDNCTINLYNGFTFNSGTSILIDDGTNEFIASVNNQEFSFNIPVNFYSPMSIDNIELTLNQYVTTDFYNRAVIIHKIINCTTGGKLINKTNLIFATQEAVDTSMTVGTFDFTSNPNRVSFIGLYSASLPSSFNSFVQLCVESNLTLQNDIHISDKLLVGPGTFNLNGYNILDVPSFQLSGGNAIITSSVATNFIVYDIVSMPYNGLNINLPVGSSFEIQGVLIHIPGTSISTSANITEVRLTTNNKNITGSYNGGSIFTDKNIVIDDIELTNSNNASRYNGTINGTTATSKYINKAIVVYNNAQEPMQTGILDCSSFTNTFKYLRAGNQDIKGGTYSKLELGGSGVKKLMGDVTVVTANYTLSGTATVDLNGHILNLI